LVDAMPLLTQTGVRVMIDHCGRPDLAKGLQEPGFQTLLELGRGGNAVIKLSGPFRYSQQAWGYTDTDAAVAELIKAFTLNNCVWGSDWPFVRHDARVDYGPMLACAKRWLPDANHYRKVLCENPARLFGFS
jgi:predicted TIM-barrel fold metal-dependent hydrolase